MMKHSPGPFRFGYHGVGGRDTGFGCGYGKSQVIDANGIPIAGVAATKPQGEPMHENGGLSKATIELVEANARFLASSTAMESALARILVLIQQGVDDNDLECIEEECKAALSEAWGVSVDEVWTPDLDEFHRESEVTEE